MLYTNQRESIWYLPIPSMSIISVCFFD